MASDSIAACDKTPQFFYTILTRLHQKLFHSLSDDNKFIFLKMIFVTQLKISATRNEMYYTLDVYVNKSKKTNEMQKKENILFV